MRAAARPRSSGTVRTVAEAVPVAGLTVAGLTVAEVPAARVPAARVPVTGSP